MSMDLKDRSQSIYDDEELAAQEHNERLQHLKELEGLNDQPEVKDAISKNPNSTPTTGDIKKSESTPPDQSLKDKIADKGADESGGLYNAKGGSRSDKLKDRFGFKGKGILKDRKKVLLLGGGGGLAGIAIIILLIILASLKLPHFSQVLTATGYARLNGIMNERMTQNLFDNAATTGEGTITLKKRSLLERVKGENLNKQITTLGQEKKVKFILEDGNVVGVDFPASGKRVTLDSVANEISGKNFSEIKKIRGFRERMAIRNEWINQVKNGANEGLATESRAVRGRVTEMALKNSGFKYNRWVNKAREYLGKTPEEAKIKNTGEAIEEISGKNGVKTGIEQLDQLSEEQLKNRDKIQKYMEKNGGEFDKADYFKTVEADFAKGQKITEVASKVGIGVMVGTMACMANQAFSHQDDVARSNERSASQMALALPAAQDQQLQGATNDEAIGAEASTLTGAEGSPYYQYATGQEIVGEVDTPKVTPDYSTIASLISIVTSPTTYIPISYLFPDSLNDTIDAKICGALLSPGGAIAGVALEITATAIASLFTGGGAAAVEQGGGRVALLTITKALGEATLSTAKGLFSLKSLGTLAAFGIYQYGLDLVAQKLAGTDFMGGEHGADKFERAAIGNNVLQSKRLRGMGGAPMTNQQAKQVDQPYQKQKLAYWQNQSTFARYFSIKNPYSLIGNLSTLAPANFTSSLSSGVNIVSNFSSFMNLSNLFKPILSITGLRQRALAADTDFNPYYDVVQWGYTSEEIDKIRNDPSYSYFENYDHISEDRVKQLDDKYGKCFNANSYQYDVQKMDECSSSELRKNDEMFRYRLTKLDEEVLQMLGQQPEDIGN